MVYVSDELKEASFAVLEDAVVKKLVFKRTDGSLLEVPIPDVSGVDIEAVKSALSGEFVPVVEFVPGLHAVTTQSGPPVEDLVSTVVPFAIAHSSHVFSDKDYGGSDGPRFVLLGAHEDNSLVASEGVLGLAAGTNGAGSKIRSMGVVGDGFHTGAGRNLLVAGVGAYAALDGPGDVTRSASIYAWGTEVSGGGTIDHNFGLLVESQHESGAETNWDIWTGPGSDTGEVVGDKYGYSTIASILFNRISTEDTLVMGVASFVRTEVADSSNTAHGVTASSSGTNNVTNLTGMDIEVFHDSSGTLVNAWGSYANIDSLGAITNAIHYYAQGGALTAGAVANAYGFKADNLAKGNNRFGFWTDQSAAAGVWAFYGAGTASSHFGGDVDITGKFGANGSAPQAKATLGAIATDLASVVTLANSLRAMALANGLGQ